MNFDLFTPTLHSFNVFSVSITDLRLNDELPREGRDEQLLDCERA